MKILLLLDTLAVGGAETSTLAIVRELVPSHDITVATLYGAGGLEEKFTATGAKVIVHNLNEKYGFFRGRRYLRRLIQASAPDVVHAALFRSEIIARLALWGSKIPLVNSFVNDSYSRYHFGLKSSVIGKLKLRGIQGIDFLTKGMVDHFTAITHSTKQQNIRDLGVPDGKVTVIYRGRSINSHTARAGDEPASDGLTFLTTSRLIWRKGYRESLYAIAHLPSDRRVTYLIAGDGVDAEGIRNYAMQLPNSERFQFLGEVADVATLYPQADYFIMPSHYEGLGGALIEAMLAKLPIVASDIPVFREVTGGNALFFRVTDEKDLLDRLSQLKDLPDYADMIHQAHSVATERYDIRQVARATLSLYQRVIQNK